jgi:UDP-3-O-[3-hydroxymyristoyl] glucosamine N-acyltransferase
MKWHGIALIFEKVIGLFDSGCKENKMKKKIDIVELANMVKGEILGNFKGVRIAGTCAIDNYVANRISFIRNKMDIQDFFYSDQFIIMEEGIAQTAKTDSSARIGKKVYLGENTYIGKNAIIGEEVKILHNSVIFDDVVIGNGTYIYPNVDIYKNCEIGDDCIIHSGVKIGIDGFRFEQNSDQKSVRKMLHVGKVEIGDRVEIGANSTIDRATFQDSATILSDDVKIDDQVHIGHNAKIGARTCIAAQTCISGSVKIGEDVFAGAGVTVSDGVNIGNQAKLLLNAVVAYDVPEDGLVSGFYAMPHLQWKRVFNKLKEI